jgi:hypothetical protein
VALNRRFDSKTTKGPKHKQEQAAYQSSRKADRQELGSLAQIHFQTG